MNLLDPQKPETQEKEGNSIIGHKFSDLVEQAKKAGQSTQDVNLEVVGWLDQILPLCFVCFVNIQMA